MSDSIKVTGIQEAIEQFKDIREFLKSTKPMEGIVQDIKETILEKTSQGHDYMNRRFKPYSKAYAKRKGKTRVDLRDTGDMLDSIRTEVISPKHGRVMVTNKRLIAQFHNTGTRKMAQREFMNLSKSAKAKLVKKHYDDPLLELAKARRLK